MCVYLFIFLNFYFLFFGGAYTNLPYIYFHLAWVGACYFHPFTTYPSPFPISRSESFPLFCLPESSSQILFVDLPFWEAWGCLVWKRSFWLICFTSLSNTLPLSRAVFPGSWITLFFSTLSACLSCFFVQTRFMYEYQDIYSLLARDCASLVAYLQYTLSLNSWRFYVHITLHGILTVSVLVDNLTISVLWG